MDTPRLKGGACPLRADRHGRGHEARQQSASPACPPKDRYSRIDAARWAHRYGVPFEINRAFLTALGTGTFDYQILTRGAPVARDFDAAMFAAIWSKPQDIGTYSDWPTIPQLYVSGTFVCGCDIVREMHETCEPAEPLASVEKETSS
jgi:hypothetical protein